ncbi:unnamed protein product [Xylocopa violacea]|uniref:Reverse transcriptase zinc-binding domain-containing protein n=1 Tax=Xylocopa violacea TaxID=135666 RepID=A0ABP1N6U3_XYLVO
MLCILLNRIRANHYNLAASRWRKDLTDSPMCECGLKEEDVNHVIWKCSRYVNERVDLIKKDIKEKIKEKNLVVVKMIAAFFKKIKRNLQKSKKEKKEETLRDGPPNQGGKRNGTVERPI